MEVVLYVVRHLQAVGRAGHRVFTVMRSGGGQVIVVNKELIKLTIIQSK